MNQKQSDELNSDCQSFPGETVEIATLNHAGWTVSLQVGAQSHG